MPCDRREFLQLNASALTGLALTPAIAAGRGSDPVRSTDTPLRSNRGFYRFALHELEITVFDDGFFDIPSDVLDIDMDAAELLATNVDQRTREEYFRSRLVPPDDVPVQASPVLLDSGTRRVLVDSGWAVGAGPPSTVGHLESALAAAGVAPESIDAVVLTHAHPDHLGGLLDPVTDQPFFPSAEIVLSDVELENWTGDDPADSPLLPEVQRVLGAVEERVRTIGVDDEVASGIRSLPSPGHTPGHIALMVDAGDEPLLLVGDAITNIHSAFERPDWHFLFDAEPARAGRTRSELLDQAATDRTLMFGYHFPFPGLGYALRDGEGYRWHPAGWGGLQ